VVFTASQLGVLVGYISRPFDTEESELDKSQSVAELVS
jgi:hypothetical protein